MSITWLIIIGVISVALITISIFCLVTIHHHRIRFEPKIQNNNKSPRITESVKDIPVYAICLERKRKTRCDVMLPEIKKVFPLAEWVNAVDMKDINYKTDPRVSIYSKYHIKNNLDTDVSHLHLKGALGCSLSHIKCWEKIVENQKPSIIVEDDLGGTSEKTRKVMSKVPEIVKTIPKNVDYAAIIYTFNSGKEPYDNKWNHITDREFRGTMMQYVTPEGAKKLLEHAYPINVHVDRYIGYLANVSDDFNAVAAVENPGQSKSGAGDSSIGHEIRVKKILPESNLFYIVVISCVVILLVLSVIGFTRNPCKKRK